MIDKFVSISNEHKAEIEDLFKSKHPGSYKEVIRNVVTVLAAYDDEYEKMDPERIHQIDDGHYQGTLVFIIGEDGYQPSKYWAVKVGYGSCSGCDTLEGIRGYSDDLPNEQQVSDYMILSLHIVQGLKEI